MDLQSLRRRFAHLRQPDDAARTRQAYIAEAAFEYFITLTTGGTFLTLLIKQMGVSDALTGIIRRMEAAYRSVTGQPVPGEKLSAAIALIREVAAQVGCLVTDSV